MGLRLDLEAGESVAVSGPATFKLRHKSGRRAVVEVEALPDIHIRKVPRAEISEADEPDQDSQAKTDNALSKLERLR